MKKSSLTQADALFRELLKELRLAKSVTQAQLARRLGRPQSYVSKFENGERRLDFVETAYVCEALGVRLEHVARSFSSRLSTVRRRPAINREGA